MANHTTIHTPKIFADYVVKKILTIKTVVFYYYLNLVITHFYEFSACDLCTGQSRSTLLTIVITEVKACCKP